MTDVETDEFPGSVGLTPAVDAAHQGDSDLDLTGGQRFWLASTFLLAVLAIVGVIVVMIRIGADENRGGGTAAAASGPATEWTVSATEFAFAPGDVIVPVGEEISVTMDNDGSVEHEWVVLRSGVRISDESEFTEDMVLARTDLVGGGVSTTANFTLDEAGTYQIVCTVAGHFSAGMAGTLRAES